MNLIEAIEQCKENPDLWFRPVSWKNCGEAFAIEFPWTIYVPKPNSGSQFMTCSVDWLIGEWEVVSPNEVLLEREDSRTQ